MQDAKILLQEAENSLRIASHLLDTTLPMVKELKLLKPILKNIDVALTKTLQAVIQDAYNHKKIMFIPKEKEAQIRLLTEELDKKYIQVGEKSLLIRTVSDILTFVKESKTEFIREDKLVFCTNKYNMQQLTKEKVHQFLILAKEFFQQAKEQVF